MGCLAGWDLLVRKWFVMSELAIWDGRDCGLRRSLNSEFVPLQTPYCQNGDIRSRRLHFPLGLPLYPMCK